MIITRLGITIPYTLGTKTKLANRGNISVFNRDILVCGIKRGTASPNTWIQTASHFLIDSQCIETNSMTNTIQNTYKKLQYGSPHRTKP
jgi:hypothetical protein